MYYFVTDKAAQDFVRAAHESYYAPASTDELSGILEDGLAEDTEATDLLVQDL
jgi:hypothetical protein|tara:strand:- start:252 stop:410 length:159 start_codon:yes stop_codon:yes gene_type:complete